MYATKHFFFKILGLLIPCVIHGQIPADLEEIVLSNELEEEGARQYTDQIEYINALLQHPINLNTAGRDELARIYFLNEFQVRAIIDYRQRYGPFRSIYELNYVFGFDRSLVQKLVPFVNIGNDLTLQSVARVYGNSHDMLVRYKTQLETPVGYGYQNDTTRSSYFLGNKSAKLIRYTFRPNEHITAGLRGEKDAGEAFFNGSNKHGFDHYSAYAEIKDIGRFKQICLGDYGINMGQGLTFSTNHFFHSGNAETVVNSSAPLRASASADENRFLRGLSARYQWKNLEFVPFVSRKKVDANITDTLAGGSYKFTSLQMTGRHATPAEVYDKKSLTETIVGLYSSIGFEQLRIGIGTFQINRNGIFEPSHTIPQYTLHPEFRAVSLDFKLTTGKVLWFGELSQSTNNLSWLGGMHIFPSSNLYFTFLLRNYNESEKHAYRHPFSIGSNINFQHGAFCGITLKPFRNMAIRAYFDRYISHQPEYLLNQRQQKSYTFGEITLEPTELITLKGRIKHRRQKGVLANVEEPAAASVNENSITGQFNFYYDLSEFRYHLQLTQQAFQGYEKENGQLIGNHIVYKPSGMPFQFKTGQFLYRSDGYNSRLYAYEPDVLYAFSIPAFYEKGVAYYAMIKWSFEHGLDIWFKYRKDLKPYAEELGSGLNRVNANHRSYLTAQVRWRF